jgi:hypothetical protein
VTLLNQVRLIIDEPNGPKFWPNTQLYDAINEASIEVLGSGQFDMSTATITASANAVYLTLPTTIMIPKMLIGTDNVELPKTTYAALERDGIGWGTATGTSHVACVEFDCQTLQLYPIVNTPVVYRVVGIPYPTEITTGVEDIAANDIIVDAIRFYAGSVLFDATRPDISDTLRVEGLQTLQVAMRHKRNTQSHKIYHLSPAGDINARRSGEISVLRNYR